MKTSYKKFILEYLLPFLAMVFYPVIVYELGRYEVKAYEFSMLFLESILGIYFAFKLAILATDDPFKH